MMTLKAHDNFKLKILKTVQTLKVVIISSEKQSYFFIGWWFVADNAGKQGWAPATYLEPVKNATDDFGYDWVSVITEGKGTFTLFFNIIHWFFV